MDCVLGFPSLKRVDGAGKDSSRREKMYQIDLSTSCNLTMKRNLRVKLVVYKKEALY
jgi:hypothetical protein